MTATAIQTNQRSKALEVANRHRTAMAAIKRSLQAGETDPLEVIRDCRLPLRVIDLLGAIPNCGAVKAIKAIDELTMTARSTLGGRCLYGHLPITDWQREELLEYVAARTGDDFRWHVNSRYITRWMKGKGA